MMNSECFLKPFHSFEKTERALGKFFLLFFPQSSDKPCYEALQLSHNNRYVFEPHN